MSIFLRVLLALYAFCIAVLSTIFMLIAFEHRILSSINYYLSETVLENVWATVLMLVIALLFFTLSIIFLLSGFKVGKTKKSVSRNTDVGKIQISLDAIESIALAASRRVEGVGSTHAVVEKTDEDVSITIKMNVLPDANIPSLSEGMQQEVKRAVEGSSGVSVKNVQVVVEDISEPDAGKHNANV